MLQQEICANCKHCMCSASILIESKAFLFVTVLLLDVSINVSYREKPVLIARIIRAVIVFLYEVILSCL